MADTIQAQIPRFAGPFTMLQQLIQNQINNSLQNNSVSMGGVNFRVKAGVFQLKNLDTGLYNRVDSFGADGTQGVAAQNGVA